MAGLQQLFCTWGASAQGQPMQFGKHSCVGGPSVQLGVAPLPPAPVEAVVVPVAAPAPTLALALALALALELAGPPPSPALAFWSTTTLPPQADAATNPPEPSAIRIRNRSLCAAPIG